MCHLVHCDHDHFFCIVETVSLHHFINTFYMTTILPVYSFLVMKHYFKLCFFLPSQLLFFRIYDAMWCLFDIRNNLSDAFHH